MTFEGYPLNFLVASTIFLTLKCKNVSTYAISWAFSEWKIRVGMPGAFVLIRESLRIKSCRIGIVIRVVMEAINWYDDPHARWQLHIGVRYLVLVLASS